MVDWGLGRLCSWDFLIILYNFFYFFEGIKNFLLTLYMPYLESMW